MKFQRILVNGSSIRNEKKDDMAKSDPKASQFKGPVDPLLLKMEKSLKKIKMFFKDLNHRGNF